MRVRNIEERNVHQFSRIIALLAATILFAMSQIPTPASAQQDHSANLEINLPEVLAEVKAAHDRYNDAINAGDIAVINSTFYNDDRTLRFGQADMEYSYNELEAFRRTAQPLVPPRVLIKTVITTYGRHFATASILTRRANQPGKVGRQMQPWVKSPEGWRVVAAHVSTIDEPSAGTK
jgi:Protein of unknown function (DUF3225)